MAKTLDRIHAPLAAGQNAIAPPRCPCRDTRCYLKHAARGVGRRSRAVKITLAWVCADPTENLLFVSKAILVTPAECTNRRADSKPQLGAWAGNVLWSDPDLARDRRFAASPLEEARFEPSVPRKAPDTDAFKRRCSASVCGCRACSLGASNDSRRLSAVPTVGDSGNERLGLSRPGGICAVEPAMLCDFCETEMEHCRPPCK